ncbi:MAG: outer membrane protein assembly factor BamE [Ignavibacteriales bacterium]
MKRIAVAVALAGMLAGCGAGRDFSMESVDKLKPGMTTDEVKAIMGPPYGVTVMGNRAIWTWTRYSSFEGMKSATVTFVDGKMDDTMLKRSSGASAN